MAGRTALKWVAQRADSTDVSWVETMVVKWVGLMGYCWAARTVAMRAGSRAVKTVGLMVEEKAGLKE